jgi:hypothetical protein
MPKPRRKAPTPTQTLDTDGQPIVVIPLASGGTAKILQADWQNWIDDGRSTYLTLNDNGTGCAYVRCPHPTASGSLVTVARVLMGARRGQNVKYRDGDRTNLRRDNLYLVGGPAKRHDAAIRGWESPRDPSGFASQETLSP